MKMRPTFVSFRFSLLLALFVAATAVLGQSQYLAVLQSADWNWQTCDGVTYGRVVFSDLYGSPQVLAIAKYQLASVNTELYDKEHSTMGTDGLALEAGATAAINGSYFNVSNVTSCTALWMNGTEIATAMASWPSRAAHSPSCPIAQPPLPATLPLGVRSTTALWLQDPCSAEME